MRLRLQVLMNPDNSESEAEDSSNAMKLRISELESEQNSTAEELETNSLEVVKLKAELEVAQIPQSKVLALQRLFMRAVNKILQLEQKVSSLETQRTGLQLDIELSQQAAVEAEDILSEKQESFQTELSHMQKQLELRMTQLTGYLEILRNRAVC